MRYEWGCYFLRITTTPIYLPLILIAPLFSFPISVVFTIQCDTQQYSYQPLLFCCYQFGIIQQPSLNTIGLVYFRPGSNQITVRITKYLMILCDFLLYIYCMSVTVLSSRRYINIRFHQDISCISSINAVF